MSNETQPLAHEPVEVELNEPIGDLPSAVAGEPTAVVDAAGIDDSEPTSQSSNVSDIKSISRSVPNSSKKRYQENCARRRSKTQSLYDHSTSRGAGGVGGDKDGYDVANAVVRFSHESLVEVRSGFSSIDQMTYPRPIASINVSRVASASSDVTEPINAGGGGVGGPGATLTQSDGQQRLRPSIISLFGRMVSRNNSNADNNIDGDIGIRARILRAFSYVGKLLIQNFIRILLYTPRI